MRTKNITIVILFLIALINLTGCAGSGEKLERPPKIVSMRKEVLDSAAYKKLADAWHKYNTAYPSEDAYSNWMYATKYTENPKFRRLLKEGVKKYPGSPTLQYLLGVMASVYQEPGTGIPEMEKAAALDPSYDDPWYGLATAYLSIGDEARTDSALKHLLELGAVTDDVMDYNYNVLSLLQPNAILLTNGDNDTYPCWLLTRVVKYRPDVMIVNRSLLETAWYPERLMQEGMPSFVDCETLARLRKAASVADSSTFSGYYPRIAGDSLFLRIIAAAKQAGRPVYSAYTVQMTPVLKTLFSNSLHLGLVFLLTPPPGDLDAVRIDALDTWLKGFRTGGLDGWRLRYSKPRDSGRMMSRNFAFGLIELYFALPPAQMQQFHPQVTDWFEKHAAGVCDATQLVMIRQHLEIAEPSDGKASQ